MALNNIWGALRDLVPFVQFKKRGKHPGRSVNFGAQRTTSEFKEAEIEII